MERGEAQMAARRARIVLAASAGLAVLLVAGVVLLPLLGGLGHIRFGERDPAAFADLDGHSRAVNYAIAESARDASVGRVSVIYVPADPHALTALGDDVFLDRSSSAIEPWLLSRLTGADVARAPYDPVLSDREISSLVAGVDSRPREAERAGHATLTLGAGTTDGFVLFTDERRSKVILVPARTAFTLGGGP